MRTDGTFFLCAKRAFSLILAVAVLAACASEQGAGPSSTRTGAGYYKVGQPYQISGTWYYPREDYSYDETGIASWYGQAFHEQTTANGEIFNKNELTAAHRTLPMPSLARVTNLDNGRSIVVRVNDRGPFSNGRIIDVSQRAAQLLGFEKTGTAKVRVQVLADESKAIADAMRRYGGPTQLAAAASAAPTPTAAPLSPVSVQSLDNNPAPNQQVTAQQLPQPLTKVEEHEIMATIKPVPEVRQLPVTGQNRIYVQAGAFTVLENANKVKQLLSSVGPANISDTVINGRKFYRVRLGPIADVPQADSLLQKVTRAGVNQARIVVN